MFILKWFLIPLAVAVAGAIGAGQMDFFQSLTPTDLGMRSGKLKPPSRTDNSVSSQAALYPEHPRHLAAQIASLPLRGDGPATLARIGSIVKVMAGAKIIKSEADYLYAQYTTPLIGFVDDVESGVTLFPR